jgi:hypothetical protein
MKRVRALFIALSLVALSAGVVFAFEPLPDASGSGLDRATEASGKTLPARPASAPGLAIAAAARAALTLAAEAADAAAHGAAVSEAAKADDTTPDTNHGQDVSEVARDNHGQATAAEHKPADAGPPDAVGKPDGAGKPDDAGQPEDPGPPDGVGKPEDVGRP